MKNYNYILVDPRNPGKYSYEGLNFSLLFEPFYVGKGKGYRKNKHTCKCNLTKTMKSRKIQAILNCGHDLRDYVVQVNKDLCESEAYNYEIELIKIIGRVQLKTGPLSNMTDGGSGVGSVYIKKINGSRKGKTYEEFYGEEKAKELRELRRKESSRKHSEESKQKVREKMKERTFTEDHKNKIKETLNTKPNYCIHCGNYFNAPSYSRWHGENCKENGG